MRFIRDLLDRNRTAVLEALGAVPSGRNAVLATPTFQTSLNVVYIVVDDESSLPVLVVKRARGEVSKDRIEHESAILRRLAGFPLDGVITTPLVIATENLLQGSLLIETALNGVALNRRFVRRHMKHCLTVGTRWALSLHRATVGDRDRTEWISRESCLFDQLAHDQLVCNTDGLRKTAEESAALAALHLPRVLEHGDLSDPNLFLLENESLGVVDWELGNEAGLPMADLFFFIAYVAAAMENAQRVREYINCFKKAFFGKNAWAIPYIQHFQTEAGLDGNATRGLFLLCWLHQLANFVSRSTIASERMTAKQLEENRWFAYWLFTAENIRDLKL